MRVVAVVTMQAKPRTCCGAFTLFRMYRRGKSAGLTPAAVSMLGLGLSVFKDLRQADQHSAHERGIILRERVHDLQSSLARRTHGSLRFPCVRTERLLHVRACVGSPARDVVENGFPLLFGAVARLLGGLLDAVEELDIPETIPNPVVVPKPTPTPTEPAPKEPVRIPERVPGTARVACSAGRSGQSDRGGRGMERRHRAQ